MTDWSAVRPYLAGVILGLTVVAAIWLVRGRETHETWVTIEPLPDDREVTVFVGGAVARPGVYTLKPGDRVEAALAAAGGLSEEADPDGLNRALRLRDEAQVIVPRRGEPRPTTAAVGETRPASTATRATTGTVSAGSAAASRAPTAPAGRINVNTAPAGDLERLPGVGPFLAQQIVAYRTANGPFVTPADLAKVKGISDTMVSSWTDLITYDR